MNIFFIDENPRVAATQLVDKHVVKMCLETAQILSTAHRVLDGVEVVEVTAAGRRARRWRHPRPLLDENLYRATHVNHPSSAWARDSIENYNWLYCHFSAILEEYTLRYNKTHAAERLLCLLASSPENIPTSPGTPIPLAMPDEYKVSSDPVECYRRYYELGKRHLHEWTSRAVPTWMALDDERHRKRELEKR